MAQSPQPPNPVNKQQFLIGLGAFVVVLLTVGMSILLAINSTTTEQGSNTSVPSTQIKPTPSLSTIQTRVPTATTDNSQPTATLVVPTETSSPATDTPTVLPATPTNLLPTPTVSTCIKPENWFTYSVQPGDTLSSLSRRIGSSPIGLRSANCLVNEDIFVGQILLLPRQPDPLPTVTPTSTTPHTNTPLPVLTATPSPVLLKTPTLPPTLTATPPVATVTSTPLPILTNTSTPSPTATPALPLPTATVTLIPTTPPSLVDDTPTPTAHITMTPTTSLSPTTTATLSLELNQPTATPSP